MILETYDKELHDKTLRNEGYETGKTAGISSERENGISRLLSALQELNISQRDAYTKLKEKYNLIPFCPEIYGGLTTPRCPSERVGERVMMKDGTDVTENYKRGALIAYKMCCIFNCKKALLKERSPSCGCGQIYDGSFSGRLTEGDGCTAELLKSKGINVIGESQIEKIM